MSFYTSLSGLRAAQTDLSVTSNNVANVGTIGFKRSRAEFGDVIAASQYQSDKVPGQGTRLQRIAQQFGQGGFQTTDNVLDLAISGQGFFVTREGATGGGLAFTRSGHFGMDKNRYVNDGRGNYLQVLPVDADGIVTATGLAATRNLQIPLTSGVAEATGGIAAAATLPSSADLPAARDTYTAANPWAFDPLDADSYNFSAATSVFDAAGNEVPATLYYVRTGQPTDADPTSRWQAHLVIAGAEVSSDAAQATPPVPLAMTFDAAGALVAPTGRVTFAPAQPSAGVTPLSLTVDLAGTTQGGATFGLKSLTQDGHAAGQFDTLSIGEDGLVTASFSNGDLIPLGRVALASFVNPQGLHQQGDASWSMTGSSGAPIMGTGSAGGFGAVVSGSLEQANVDLTEELVSLITAQRNFQANAKAIETANALTQTIVNLG